VNLSQITTIASVNMNPFSIVASVDRVCSLVSVLEDVKNAPADVASLRSELSHLRTTFEELQSLPIFSPSLRNSIARCLNGVAGLESLIGDIGSNIKMRGSKRTRAAFDSFAWVRKSRTVNRVKQQLRDSISSLQLEISSLNLCVADRS
jgi:hypothetical protein